MIGRKIVFRRSEKLHVGMVLRCELLQRVVTPETDYSDFEVKFGEFVFLVEIQKGSIAGVVSRDVVCLLPYSDPRPLGEICRGEE